MVVFARCSTNNRTETNYNLFLQALPKYGRPSKDGTDLGGQNVDIWRDMTTFWGEANVPVLVEKSVHNQRIERHNRALNGQVLSKFRQQFYELESKSALDVNNDTDIFCLHCGRREQIIQKRDFLLTPGTTSITQIIRHTKHL